MTQQDTILTAIVNERERQDAQWGGKVHDVHHDDYMWLAILTKHLGKFADETMNSEGTRHEDGQDRLVKIAAICVAALEADYSPTLNIKRTRP